MASSSSSSRTNCNKPDSTKVDAVAEAARIRLRPILMTTIATVAGHMPLVFVTGAGAKARNSIGLVLVGGMTIGTIFTLFIVPSLYVLIARTHNEGREDEPDAEPEADYETSNSPARELPEPALARDGDLDWKPA